MRRKRKQNRFDVPSDRGIRASADLSQGVKATALYGGSKGNDIIIRISENVLDQTAFDVTTYMDEAEVDKQTVKKPKN